MAINKITAREIAENAVEGNLPDRPSQDSLYAERGMTAGEVKAAYDKLPKLIAERLNALIDAFSALPDGESIAAYIPTGVAEGHTLRQLFLDVLSGAFADYATVDGTTSLSELANMFPKALLTVTDADNGRYLRVVDGAWAAVASEEAPLNAPIITLSGTTVYAQADSASWGVAFYKDGVLLSENEEGYVDLSAYEWEDGVYTIAAKCIGTDRPDSPFGNTLVYVVGEPSHAVTTYYGEVEVV